MSTQKQRPFPAIVDGLLWLCVYDSNGTIKALENAGAIQLPDDWKARLFECATPEAAPARDFRMGGCPNCGRRDCVARACTNKLTLCPCHSPQTCGGYSEKDGVRCMKGSISL
jgi:hypothetical protein